MKLLVVLSIADLEDKHKNPFPVRVYVLNVEQFSE